MVAFLAAVSLFVLIWFAMMASNIRSDASYETRISEPLWRTADGASFVDENGIVSVYGPGYIYTDAKCFASVCKVDVSLRIRRALTANVGVSFLRSEGSYGGESIIKPISGLKDKVVSISTYSPRDTCRVRLIVFTPNKETIELSNPELVVKSSSSALFDFLIRPICTVDTN